VLADVIRTDRLVLRPWAFADVADVLSYANDEEWSRYLPLPQPYTEADARTFIATQVLQNRQVHPSWATEYENRVVGGSNLRFFADHQIGEMGYSICRPFWNRGFATEAARSVVGAAFEALPNLVRVRAMADARNVASTRVRGEPADEVWYGILRQEWSTRVDSQVR
jgi:[ribosomal protein S5]-alanine N-acetyltransferase